MAMAEEAKGMDRLLTSMDTFLDSCKDLYELFDGLSKKHALIPGIEGS